MLKNKLLILTVLFSWAFGQVVIAQKADKKEDSALQTKLSKVKVRYLVWPVPMDSTKGLKMSLYETQDSSLVFAHTNKRYQQGITETETVPVNQIKNIYFRKRTMPTNGAIIGGLTGLVVGGLIGGASVSKSSSSSSSSGSGFGFAPIGGLQGVGETLGGMAIGLTFGTITGMLLGSERIKISLNGDRNSYSKQREQLRKISITKQ